VELILFAISQVWSKMPVATTLEAVPTQHFKTLSAQDSVVNSFMSLSTLCDALTESSM
jgi:hypothetical protein